MEQSILSIRHYFQLKPITGTIISGDPSNFFTVKITEDYALGKNILKGDPVLYSSFSDIDDIQVKGGSVITILEKDKQMIISPDKEFNSMIERRQYERHPVSLHGNMRILNSGQKATPVCIKDMSYSGFRIYSQADLNAGDTIEVDVYLHNNILTIQGTVMRKSICYGRNEYGIQIVYRDKNSMYSIKDYMDKMLQNEKDLLKTQLVKSLVASGSL
ncbi:MAG: PilZ domain-containing protein [Clostridia bacterium]|nr:PilZ domain-containing protein [Clostridia bacterium]